jgi:DNA-directed RNA polymerase specialized sigma24 family protein
MAKLNEQQRREAEKLLPAVTSVVRKISKDDEYLSLAYLTLCEAIINFNGRGNLKGWVLWRVKTLVLNAIRDNKKMITAGDMSHLVSPEVNDELEYLPKKYREICRLSWVDGEGVSVICRLTNKPRSYVLNVLRESKEYLRSVL